ncbi:MAG: HAMP domain-containing protein, partial [Paracoccaceae bacterium]|nr:HAMP domain-containing protein [Paracoccaceae bacterium]
MRRIDPNSVKLTRKLPALMLAISSIAVVLVAGAAYIRAESALSDAARATLKAAASGPAETLAAVTSEVAADLNGLSFNRGVADGLLDLSRAVRTEPGGLSAIHDRYVTQNPFPAGERQKLLDGGSGSAFDRLHSDLQAELSAWIAAMGYQDVLLIARDGTVVYTVRKDPDFATNLGTGPWRDTGLARVFDRVMATEAPGTPVFEDFSRYGPSKDMPAAFMGRHVLARDGSVLGAVVIQMPITPLNVALNGDAADNPGLRSYLVGRDGILRSDLHQTPEDDVLSTSAASGVIKLVRAGVPSFAETTGFDGQPIVAAVQPIDVQGMPWTVVTEIDRAELFRPITVMTYWFVAIGLVVLAATSAVAILASRSIALPLQQMVTDMGRIARRDAGCRINHTERGDEIGEIARALRDMDRSLTEAEVEARKADAERLAFLDRERTAEREDEARKLAAERA